jgi:sialate O-acetylesterase
VPIGIINSSFGSAPLEAWISRRVLESDTSFKPILDRYAEACARYPQTHRAYLIKMDNWHRDTSAKKGRQPTEPLGPKSSHSPGKLYNGMIAPLLNVDIAGILWCQGQTTAFFSSARTNAADPRLNKKLFAALIRCWRSGFKNHNLPFYYIRMPPDKLPSISSQLDSGVPEKF